MKPPRHSTSVDHPEVGDGYSIARSRPAPFLRSRSRRAPSRCAPFGASSFCFAEVADGLPDGSRLERASGGAWRPSPGAVYPALSALADEGLIAGEESGGRRTFSLTDAGRAYHREWAARTFRPLLHGLRGPRRERRLAAIVIATDLLVWKLLRHDMQLDRRVAEQVVAEMLLERRSAR